MSQEHPPKTTAYGLVLRNKLLRNCIGWFSLCLALVVDARAESKVGDPISRGDIRAERGLYGIVFYFAPTPKTNTLLLAEALSKQLLPEVPFVSDLQKRPKAPFIGFQEEKAPLRMSPVPNSNYLQYCGRGLTEQDIAGLSKTDRATQLILVAPKEDVWRLGRKFTEFAQQFADMTGAYIFDNTTRELFSRDAWRQKRLTTWPEKGTPDVSSQITIHLYRIDEKSPYMRAITLGMEKFALPDIVIERMIGSDNKAGGNLINLVCQSLAEQPMIENGEKEKFQLDTLQPSALRTNMASGLEKGATREAVVALLHGKHDDGDPHNELIEIDFRHGKGATEDERRENILSTLWGAADSITAVKHTDEILAASRRARSSLGLLRASFEKGLPLGSRLLVKAPFKRDDAGNEWMWLEVTRWAKGAKIEGILQNDPFYIKRLKAGSKVEVNSADVFDYILYHGDGTSEGNETGKLMEKQSGATKSK